MRPRLQMLVGLIVIVAGGGLVVWAFIEAVQAEPAVVGLLAWRLSVFSELSGSSAKQSETVSEKRTVIE